MEKTTPLDGLATQGVDQETFERVWRRVMPDQEHSPIAVGAADGAVRTPKKSAAGRPTVEREKERPTRPRPQSEKKEPAPTGEEELRSLMNLAREGMEAGQALARRAGSRGRLLSQLFSDHRRALRHLSAAYFLMTGQRHQPGETRRTLNHVFVQALREQFLWEQLWARACLQAAERVEDSSIRELCRELAQDAGIHNRIIRRVLEEM